MSEQPERKSMSESKALTQNKSFRKTQIIYIRFWWIIDGKY